MGDSFRGLTIRLGGDTRSLDKALSSIKSSASQAEKQLKIIQSALKVDSSDAKVLARQFDLAEDKLSLTAKSALALESAIKQASDKTKTLAHSTTDIYSKTHSVKEAYNEVDRKLNVIDDDMARIAAKQDKISFKKAQKSVKQLREDLSNGGTAADEARVKIERLLTMAAKSGKTKLFGDMKVDADTLIAAYDNLRAKHNQYGNELKSVNQARDFVEAQNKLAKVKAELASAAAEAARFRAEMHAAGDSGLSKAIDQAKKLDGVIDELSADTRKMADASKAMPANYHAALAKASAFKAEQDALTAKAKALGDALKRIEKAPGFDKLKAQTVNMIAPLEKAKGEYAAIQLEVSKATSKLDRMNDVQRQLEISGKQGTKYYQNVQNAIDKCNKELSELRSRQAAADDQLKEAAMYREWQRLNSELISVQASLAGVRERASKINAVISALGRFKNVASGLYRTLTPALMIATRYAVTAAQEIDSAYRDMRKTVNGAEEDYEHLRDAAIEYSRTHVTSAATLLEIEAMGGQLGIAIDNLEAFATTVSNLDIATNMESDEIAEQLGKMASVIGLSVDEYDNFGDALVRLGNNMPVMEGDIMTVTTRFMGMGKVVGLSADEMLAWATAASATGMKSEAAGSSMLRFISNMETAVVNGGDKLSEYARVAHMTSDEFANLFKEDASEAMYKFIEGLGDMQKAGDSVNQELKVLGIGNVRDKTLLEGLANQMANAGEETDLLAYALQLAGDAYAGASSKLKDGSYDLAGDAAREAANKSEGFSGALEKCNNNLKALSSEVADGAVPVLEAFGELFYELSGFIKGLAPETKTFLVELALGLTAFGGVGLAISSVGGGVASLVKVIQKHSGALAFPQFAAAAANAKKAGGAIEGQLVLPLEGVGKQAGKAEKAVGKMKSALGKLTWGKLAIAVAAFAALAGAVKYAWDKYQTWNTAHNKFLSMVSGSAPKVGDLTKSVEGLGSGMHNVAVNYDEALSSHAKLAESIEERNSSAQVEIDRLEAAKEAIKKYSGQSELSGEQLGEFRIAIETVNDMCGTQLSLADGVTGAIRNEEGALVDVNKVIDDYITKKQRQIEVDTLTADYNDVYADRAAKIQELASVSVELADAEKYAESGSKYWQDRVAELNGQVEGLTKMIEDDDVALQNYSYRMGQVASGAKVLSSTWSDVFKGATGGETAFVDFEKAINNLGVNIDDLNKLSYKDVIDIANSWINGEKTISQALSDAGISVGTFTDALSQAFSAQGRSFEDLAGSLEVHADVLAAALQGAGVSAKDMANISEENIAKFVDESGGKLDIFVQKVAEVSNHPIKVTSEYDSSGTDEAKAEGEGYEDEEYSSKTTTDASGAEEGTQEAEDAGESYDGDVFTATANLDTSPAHSALDSLLSRLNSYDNLHITADANISSNAAGGVSSRLIRAIPKNAQGGAMNGIVTRATLTNRGWIGEAGDEAILHMKHAGGAIIPLSNRQHVRPFARAVAAEMPMNGSVSNITNIYIDGAQINARPEMRDEFYRCMTDLKRVAGA